MCLEETNNHMQDFCVWYRQRYPTRLLHIRKGQLHFYHVHARISWDAWLASRTPLHKPVTNKLVVGNGGVINSKSLNDLKHSTGETYV